MEKLNLLALIVSLENFLKYKIQKQTNVNNYQPISILS